MSHGLVLLCIIYCSVMCVESNVCDWLILDKSTSPDVEAGLQWQTVFRAPDHDDCFLHLKLSWNNYLKPSIVFLIHTLVWLWIPLLWNCLYSRNCPCVFHSLPSRGRDKEPYGLLQRCACEEATIVLCYCLWVVVSLMLDLKLFFYHNVQRLLRPQEVFSSLFNFFFYTATGCVKRGHSVMSRCSIVLATRDSQPLHFSMETQLMLRELALNLGQSGSLAPPLVLFVQSFLFVCVFFVCF